MGSVPRRAPSRQERGHEVLEEEASRGGHFNLIHGDTALRADVYLAGTDPHDRRYCLTCTGRRSAGASP